jgi:hypothetical protein
MTTRTHLGPALLTIAVFAALSALGAANRKDPLPRSTAVSRTTANALRHVPANGATAVPGYAGPYYNDGARSDSVVVISESLKSRPGETWSIAGLIRNETDGMVIAPRVSATLLDRQGKTITTASASVPLVRVRPGEPAPFTITSPVSNTDVGSVIWAVTYARTAVSTTISATTDGGDTVFRDFELSVFWHRPYGGERRLAGYPYADSAVAPYPYVVLGSIRNVDTRAVNSARVLGAWLNSQGQVVHVDWLSLRPGGISPGVQSSDIPGNTAIDFFYRNSDPEIAPLLNDSNLILWGANRE